MKSLIFLCLSLVSLAVLQNPSQKSLSIGAPANPGDNMPSLAQVLDKYLEAIGGEEPLKNITSRAGKGTFTSTRLKTKGPVELYAKAPNKQLLVLLATGFGNYRRGSNGKIAWEKLPFDDEASNIASFSKLDSDFYQAVSLRKMSPAAVLKGREQLDGREAYIVETPVMKNFQRWYFDAQTGLLIRMELRNGPGKILKWQEYGDYRSVDRLKVPFILREVDIDGIDFNIRLDSVRHNVEIADASFEKPAKAKRSSSAAKGPRNEKPQVHFASGESALNIPFEFDDNSILLPVRINNATSFTFSIDTGASIFGVITSQRAEDLGLKPHGEYKVSVVGGDLEAASVSGASLTLPGLELTNRQLEVIRLDDKSDGPPVDGALGHDFLKEFIVEIDFQKKVIDLYDRAHYRYSGDGEIVPLKIKDSTPTVLLKLTTNEGRMVQGRFIVDTGLGGTLAFFTPSVKKNNLGQEKTIEAATSVEAGGDYHRRIARVRSLQLGRILIENPTVSFSQDTEGGAASTEFDGVLGIEILRRFKLVLDYPHRRLILEPNEHFKEPYEEDMSGIAIDPDMVVGAKVFKVRQVLSNTPGSEVGLREGDFITAIGGEPAGRFTQSQIEKMFMQSGREYVLTIKRSEQTLQMRLKLRRLV